MNFRTYFLAEGTLERVFAATHQHKLDRNPGRFFSSHLVSGHFQVLTDHTLGPGAVSDWKIGSVGVPVLAFQEQVVEWCPGRRVAYRAISGWEMSFPIDLEPRGKGTGVTVNLDISLGHPCADRALRPAVAWGLERVCRRGPAGEGIPATRQGFPLRSPSRDLRTIDRTDGEDPNRA